MKMPMHIFIAMCNILAGQFKEEAEKQEKEQQEASADLPNFNSSFDLSNFSFPSIPGLQ